MSCLDDPRVRAGFERSNLPPERWAHAAGLVDEMCREQGVSSEDPGSYAEYSEVEVYRFPDGTPGVTDTHLLAVLDVGLVLMREVGMLRKRTDSQFMFFKEFGNGSFLPQERMGGRGWGSMDIQAAQGSIPLFRLGWSFDERSRDPRLAINAAAGERDRILAAIQRWT